MKTVKIKINAPHHKDNAEIHISDTVPKDAIALWVTLCEAEATIIDAMEMINGFTYKNRNRELQKVIEAQFDCLRNQIMQYNHIDKSEIVGVPFWDVMKCKEGMSIEG